MRPFTDIEDSNASLYQTIVSAIDKLINQDADTIVFGGSYFIGRDKAISEILRDEKYKALVVIDPLSLAIRFAQMLVDAKLLHCERIYATPTHDTPVIGYPLITSAPGVSA